LIAAAFDPTALANNLSVFLNTGSASQPFGSPEVLQPDNDLGGVCLGVSVGDVNGDGLPHISDILALWIFQDPSMESTLHSRRDNSIKTA
jgi:hypothetical protein